MNIQDMVDGMNARMQRERAGTQFTLGTLIKALEGLDGERRISGLGRPISYRGYYCDLAFEPGGDCTVAEALAAARGAMGKVFVGYKGGGFMMGEATPVWSAGYGDCGDKIVGLNVEADPIALLTESDE